MLTESVERFTSPCLDPAWKEYRSTAAAFALLGLFVTQYIQIAVGTRLSQAEDQVDIISDVDLEYTIAREQYGDRKESLTHVRVHEEHIHIRSVRSLDEVRDEANGHSYLPPRLSVEHHDHAHHGLVLKSNSHLGVYMLELGIASHSILIGIALGTSSSDEFLVLLGAITIHQFFEGIALSVVVLEAEFERRTQAWLMVLFYTLTTPIGIIIGMALRSVYNANASSTLVAQGTLDALAAGILTFDGIVNIVQPALSSRSFKQLPGWKQHLQFLSLWLGAAAMAIIGYWT
jgi:zinc transporter 1/2/3